MRRSEAWRLLIVLCGVVSTLGCVLVAAGAGAGGAVYFTSRGAESMIPASVDRVFDATDRAFEESGIERTSYTVEEDGLKRTLEGRSLAREADVTVSIEQTGAGDTRVQVSAQTGPVTWDREFARELLGRIVELSG